MTACREPQRGALILGGLVLLLILVTCIVSATIRVGVGDQRSLSHEITRRQLMALAESGRARALVHLQHHPRQVRQATAAGWLDPSAAHWTACSSADVELPCGDGARNRHAADWSAYRDLAAAVVQREHGTTRVHALARTADLLADTTQPMVLTLVSQALDVDQQARVVVYQEVLIAPLITALPPAPILADQLEVSGDASLVANVDGAGPGLALTAWTNANTELIDEARSCTPVLLIDAACAVAGAISKAGSEGEDILDRDGNQGSLADSRVAAGDVLERVLGVSAGAIDVLQSLSRRIDCSQSAAPEPGHLWWSSTDCRMPTDAVWGSASAPLILVVEGEFQAQGGRFHGLLLLLSRDAAPRVAQFDEGFQLNGALLSNTALQLRGNRYRIAYEPNALRALMQSVSAPLLATPVPGSWRDFP